MEFEFDLHREIIDQINLFNEILTSLKTSAIFENSDFQLDRDSAGTNSIRFTVKSPKKNTAQMWLFLESDGVRLDIDGMNELFEWSNESIKQSKEKFINFIQLLLTGYILIETRGASRFIQIFNEDGFFEHSSSYNNLFHMLTGLYLFRYKNYRRLYLPIYSISR